MKMTRQEASEIIEQYRMCSSGDCPTLECADCEYNHDPRKVEEAFLMAIDALESAQPEPLTDREQRIFLAAMGREEKVCEEVERNRVLEAYEDSLMWICREIKRKVKGALWT